MKLTGCGNKIYRLLSHQFKEGIVVTVIRQFGENNNLKLNQKFGEGIVASLRRQLNQILLYSASFVFYYPKTLKELNYGE